MSLFTDNIIREWNANRHRIFQTPKYDGTSDTEPVKILRFVAICQSTETGLFVVGLDNNVETFEIEVEDLFP